MPVESCTQALSDVALSFGEDDDDDKEGKMVSVVCVVRCSCVTCIWLWVNMLVCIVQAVFCNAECTSCLYDDAACHSAYKIACCDLCLVAVTVQSRPFGVALLLAGWDSDGPVL